MVSLFILCKMNSNSCGLLILSGRLISSSFVGSLDIRIAIVCERAFCLWSVFQFGVLFWRENNSSSSFILASKSPHCKLFSRECVTLSKILFLIEFLISLWYEGSLCALGGHLKVPTPLDVFVTSISIRILEWSVFAKLCAMCDMCFIAYDLRVFQSIKCWPVILYNKQW